MTRFCPWALERAAATLSEVAAAFYPTGILPVWNALVACAGPGKNAVDIVMRSFSCCRQFFAPICPIWEGGLGKYLGASWFMTDYRIAKWPQNNVKAPVTIVVICMYEVDHIKKRFLNP